MVFKPSALAFCLSMLFENDVKMYGIQTTFLSRTSVRQFENDVKMYGIQTHVTKSRTTNTFENDVKMYGIQTKNSTCS